MERPLDKHAFLEVIEAQEVYERPLEEGFYLGFLVQGARVVMSRIESLAEEKAPLVVACPVTRLFR